MKSPRGTFDTLLRGAVPNSMTGLSPGLGASWARLVPGAITVVPNGSGVVTMDARMVGRIDRIAVGIIVITAIGRVRDQPLEAGMKPCFESARRTA